MTAERITNTVFQNIPPEQIDVENPATVMPGRRNLRISVTPRCNLRCPHCHNEGQPPPWSKRKELDRYESTVDDIGDLVEVATHFGVESVKLTGGDPGMYKHLESLFGYITTDWQKRMRGVTWGINTNGAPFLNPRKLALLVESPINKVTFGIDSLIEGEMSKPYSRIGVSGVKLFRDLVVPLAKERKGTSKELLINVVYTGNEERVLSVVRASYEQGITANIIEVNGIMGTRYETRQAYLDLLNKIARTFNFNPQYFSPLNQVYLYENGNNKSPAVKFFQDHCADRDCGNCRKIHMRVIPTQEGFAAIPCFLQKQNETIPLTTNGAVDKDKFAEVLPLLSIGPDWKNEKRE